MIAAKRLANLGLVIYATEGTHRFLKESGFKNTRVYKISEKKHPSIVDLLKEKKVDLAINISEGGSEKGETDGFIIRRNCIDLGIPLVTNLQSAETLVLALTTKKVENLEIRSWDEYVKG